MITCPKCGSELQARSQLLYYHEITCPVCTSRLEVKTSSRLIAAAVIAPFIPIVLALNLWFFWPPINPLVVYGEFLVVVLLQFLFLYTVFYSKFLKFKIKLKANSLKLDSVNNGAGMK
jgi:DNA-directed RNA polymerase subunit RPC12/RpoP